MATVVKKPSRKTATRRPAAKKLVTPAVRLVPPSGPTAADFFASLPPPAKDFDAEGVERIVALRSRR